MITPVLCGVIQNKAISQNYNSKLHCQNCSWNLDYINFRSADLLYELNWASVEERCDYLTSMMIFKAIKELTTPYLTDLKVRANEAHERNSRLTNSYDVHVPSHHSEILKRFFVYKGSVLWNTGLNNTIGPIAQNCLKWPLGNRICGSKLPAKLVFWKCRQQMLPALNSCSLHTLCALDLVRYSAKWVSCSIKFS